MNSKATLLNQSNKEIVYNFDPPYFRDRSEKKRWSRTVIIGISIILSIWLVVVGIGFGATYSSDNSTICHQHNHSDENVTHTNHSALFAKKIDTERRQPYPNNQNRIHFIFVLLEKIRPVPIFSPVPLFPQRFGFGFSDPLMNMLTARPPSIRRPEDNVSKELREVLQNRLDDAGSREDQEDDKVFPDKIIDGTISNEAYLSRRSKKLIIEAHKW